MDTTIPLTRSRVRIRTALCAIAALLCAGCASLTTYHNKDRIPGGRAQAIIVDAKQRFVLSTPHRKGDQDILRFCAEPPPDVFTAISSSFGLKAALGTEKARQDISADIQQALSENAATIGKTQTVNILREMMYRNCERYLSGAITEEEFIVQAARDQRAIVHVLAIEQLTGAARTQSIALATKANASSSGGGEQAMKALQMAYENKQALTKAAVDAREAAEKHPPKSQCQSGDNPYPDASDSDKSEIDKKQALCREADAAEARADEAKAHYAEQKALAGRTGTLSTEASGNAEAFETESAKAQATLAKAVKDIVIANNDFDEVEMTCVVLFRNFAKFNDDISAMKSRAKARGIADSNAVASAEKFAEKCFAYVDAIASNRAAELELEAIRDRLAISELLAETAPDAQRIWKHVAPNGQLDTSKLEALLLKAKVNISSLEKHRLVSSKNQVEFHDAVSALPDDARAMIVRAIDGGD